MADVIFQKSCYWRFKNAKRKKMYVSPGETQNVIPTSVHCNKAMWGVRWYRSVIIHWEIIASNMCYWRQKAIEY